MDQFLEGFAFGSASILTTACLLPLYPGLIAFLAGTAQNERSRRATPFLGLLVLAGILSMMIVIGLGLHLLSSSTQNVLPVLLPIVYAVVIGFGGLMFFGLNPFAKMQTVQAPVLKNPYATAYVYGLLFGPMTIPCTGPIILGAFALGTVDSTLLVEQLIFFIGMGFGFGWPLVILPLLAMPLQRRLVGILAKNHVVLERGSGLLLIAVGVFGILTELLPIWTDFPVLSTEANLLYWLVSAVIILGVGFWTYRQQRSPRPDAGTSGDSATGEMEALA